MATPPPLPPRSPASLSPPPTSPPPGDGLLTQPVVGLGYAGRLHATDPRTSSSQSLIAPAVESDTRRSLLVIYIHGFYGNDQSFRSFPAHVHAFLAELLSDTHIVHSKIYPRYKTYKAIQIARDNFSAWLEPHESPTTDVILVGHSMGGLLAADVILMPNHDPHLHQPFKHRILGSLSLDSPFLGLHPGIVVSGLSSLFQPAPNPEKTQIEQGLASPSASSLSNYPSASDLHPSPSATPSIISSTSSPPANDPRYDPPYFNDVHFREKPFVTRLLNFASKHKEEGIFNAIGNHIFSHLEYGGCMADYPALSARYKKVRALEDVDELKAIAEGHPAEAYRRVRFANYYTLSSGRPKPSPSANIPSTLDESVQKLSLNEPNGEKPIPDTSAESDQTRPSTEAENVSVSEKLDEQDTSNTVVDSLEEKVDLELEHSSDEGSVSENKHISMQDLDPVPMTEEDASLAHAATLPTHADEQDELNLVPIPPEPQEPEPIDLAQFTDKDARKQAEKEAKRQQKAHQQALKHRAKALRERDKLLEKRRKKNQKEAQRSEKQALKESQREQKEREKAALLAEAAAAARDSSSNDDAATSSSRPTDAQKSNKAKREKPAKLRRFCSLPPPVDGKADETWVDVYMHGVDEVGAHCGLFAPGPHYDGLVGGVADRITGWVHEDLSTRAVLGDVE